MLKSDIVGDCTTFAIDSDNSTVLGQTIDQDGLLSDQGVVIRAKPSLGNHPEVLMYSFTGLLGYLGINSYGLAVCINLLTTAEIKVGLSPYLVVKKMLEECKTAEQAVSLIKSTPISMARSLTLFDSGKIVCCEFTTDKFTFTDKAKPFFRANHFLDGGLVEYDTLNIFSKNGSIKRQEAIEKLFVESEKNISVEGCFNILSDHTLFPTGLCAHAKGNHRSPDTVAAVVMKPESGELYARKGNPCSSSTMKYSFDLNM